MKKLSVFSFLENGARLWLSAVCRYSIAAWCYVFLLASGALAQNGPVAAYGFNEGAGATVADTSGNGNNGTISNATWNTGGKFGGALSFNGTNAWVTVNDSASLRLTTGVTIEAWVKPTALSSWRAVMMKEQSGGLVYGMYANGDTNRPGGHVYVTSEMDVRGTAQVALNVWTHLATTYDGSVLRLYVNGVQVSNRTIGGNLLTSTAPLRIGGDQPWGEYFSGLIDEVRVYNRALTASEIQTDMNAAIGTPPPPDTTPPTVSMTAPANGATVSGTVTLSANAADNVGVAGVQFLVNGTAVGAEDTTAPYSVSWNTTGVTNGAGYSITARARDAAGNQTTSTAVIVTVSNVAPIDTVPPTVSVTAPANGATVSGTVALNANAADNVGVVGVQFLVNGTAVGAEDTTAPYSVNWNTTGVANGTGYSITARARDAAGNQTTSTAVVVTVSNAAPVDTVPPTVSVTAPASGATVSGTVTLSANAADNIGVVGVQFLVNGTAVGAEDTTSPYSVSWDTTGVTNGAGYSITARARDAAGNQTTSTAVVVTVNNTTTPPPVSGLVAAYGFNEGVGTAVADASGVGNNGTISNATWDAGGKFGSALSFNGSNAWVTVNDSASLHLTTGVTIEAWVKPSVLSNWRAVMMKEQSGGLVYGMYANGDTNRPGGHVYITSESDVRGTAQVALNAWTHLATTYDGSVLRLYVNGVQVGTRTLGGNLLTSTAPLRIGGNQPVGEYFSGLIDEVRVYNRALTASEIQTDMNTAIGTTTPPPVDTVPPTVSMTAPANGATVSGTVTLSANAADNVGVAGVQFLVNGNAVGAEDTTAPYSVSWDTTGVTNGAGYSITARARDAAGNQTTSTAVVVTVSNTTTPPPSPAGLVAAYGFNEGIGAAVADASGSGNSGTISNATWDSGGKYGGALSFNGSNAWVTVNDSASLDLTTGMTIEAWVKPTVLSSWRAVMMKEQNGGLVYGMYANGDTNRPGGHVYITSEADVRGTAQVALNVWTHLATTYDGNVLRLYVNGVQVGTRTLGGNLLTSTAPLRIGGDQPWGEYFSGLIDEVRVYNRALSASEIQTDMNTAVGATTPPPVDTVPPTVSMTAPTNGATISGTVTLSADASDNVGVVGVQFYVDGAASGSESTGAPFSTTWNTASVTNASHTITAVARDGAGNQTTSGSITVTVANSTDPTTIGGWTAPFNWPIVAINMVVTRTGEVMSWDGPPSNGGTSAQLWSPTTGVFTPIPNNVTNMFCNVASVLSDGRVLAFGGHADFGVGVRNTDIFDPITKTWTPMAPMNYARWYPTSTVLPDGRVLSVSGSDTCESCIVSIPEIYDPIANTWTTLPSAPFSMALYPFMFVLPDGRILEAGTTRTSTITRVLDLGTQTWTTVDPVARDGHSAVMYEPGKVMKSGTAADVGSSTAPAQPTTYTLDMTAPSPTWQQTANMIYARAYHNLTLLPDGTVLATGGGSTRDGINYANAVLPAELWSPTTKTWTKMASQQNGRLYHGTAVLLLDGRVLVAGSGRVGPDPMYNGEIFSPPYLFKGPRPAFSATPAEATYGSTFFVGTPNASSISSVTLLRISAATHAFNMDQRFLRLNFTQTSGGLNVTAPANGNLAPPGYYVLYILNSAGVPSTGAVIRIR